MKRGQMKLSFGMIVSIILIVIFIAFAFYAINKFLDLQDTAQIAKFTKDLQSDIDRIWGGFQGSQEVEYFLPSKVKYVCLVDYLSPSRGNLEDLYEEMEVEFYGNKNLFFYPVGGSDSRNIEHINLEEITSEENPLCFENLKGKVKFTIQMDYGENLVRIK